MEKLENVELAEERVKKLNSTEPKWWCPLLNSNCRTDCVCWVGASINSNYTGFVGVYPPRCDNAMFSGYTEA